MTDQEGARRERARARALARRRRRGARILGVFGELLITGGVLVLLFLGWHEWFNNLVVGNELRQEALELSQQWEQQVDQELPPAPDPTVVPTDPTAVPTNPPEQLDPVVSTAPGNTERFAALIVPAWGEDFYRPIAQGVGLRDVLNKNYVGHYPSTQMPGETGNFAIAAHRTTYGASFGRLNELRVGDSVYVETADGWYQYVFRNLEYVRPTGVGVLYPVPQVKEAPATDRYLTLTSCNPLRSDAERIIGYGAFERWYPRADGPPEEIRATVSASG